MDAMRKIKIVIERHPDGYIGYPLGLKGVVVGEGDTFDEALAGTRSAIRFYLDTPGAESLDDEDSPVLDAYIAEASAG
jgi:predicted RNase H-like HicB family nuclease